MVNAIVTYIYPDSEKYFNFFIESLNNIDTKENMELFIFNDGCRRVEDFFIELQLKYTIVENIGSVNHNRFKSFRFLNELPLNNIYFQDIDDCCSPNRFKVLASKLETFDLVSNDLKVMMNGEIYESGIWSARLGNNFVFDHTFLMDKNIVGLGNTGIKASLLKTTVSHDETPIAYDWFFFYQLMKLNDIRAVFTDECFTYYHQHQNNIAGANIERTEEREHHIYNVKKAHYCSLLKLGHNEILPYLTDLEQKKDIHDGDNNKTYWWE